MSALKLAGWVAGLALVILVVAAAVLLTVGLPSGLVTSVIQARLERDTGYRVSIAGATRLGLWPSFNIAVHDISIRDPADRELGERLSIGRAEATLALSGLLSGQPHLTRLALERPVLHQPLLRDRIRPPVARPAPGAGAVAAVAIDRVIIRDGAVIFSNQRDRIENRVEGVSADITTTPDRRVSIAGAARLRDQPLTFDIKATAPDGTQERQTIPVRLTLEAPGVLAQAVAASAEVRWNGAMLMINGLTGTLGDSAFNGWASADLASKPLLKLDLDFQRLDLGMRSRGLPPQASQAGQPWSDAPLDLTGLNYLDAQVRLSAAEINLGDARFAPAAIDASLGSGVLKASFAHLGVYGGEADGDIGIDVSGPTPVYGLRCDLSGVRALPLLSGVADFDKIDGRMQAKIGVRGTGASPRAIMASLGGTTFVNFQDGEIRGLNLARTIRALTTSTQSGWQGGSAETTDLSQLSASFRIEKGQATTSDLSLIGPLVRVTGAGTVDLGAKALALRVEPKLVMSLEGQGRSADPVGFGIPVAIQGPWAAPQIYPDMAGMLDNPDAAYAKLRDMGKGLFGAAGGGSGQPGALGGQLGDTLGSLIQQGLGGASRSPPPVADSQAKPAAPADGQNPMNGILKQLFGR